MRHPSLSAHGRPAALTLPVSRRRFLGHSLTAACASLALRPSRATAAAVSPAHPLSGATTWGINTNIDVWHYYAKSVDEAIAGVGPLLRELPVSLVREGLQGNDRGNNLDDIVWDRWFNPWSDWLRRHGLQMCLELFLEAIPNPGHAYDAEWEKRVVHKCRTVARYLAAHPERRAAVAWFMLMNEPDLKPGAKGGFLTPARLVRAHELAWHAIKEVDPSFLIEGLTFGDGAGIGAAFPLRAFNLGQEPDTKAPPAPGQSVRGMLSKDVLDLGITRYCDLVGFHSYVEITEDNPHGARALVRNMRDAHQRFGYPIRPLVNTETGCHDKQLNRIGASRQQGRLAVEVSEAARYQGIAHWQHYNRVQQARWGVARSAFYLLSGSPGAPWMHIADYPMRTFKGVPWSKRPSFATAQAALAARPLATLNGGFEAPEDKFSNWVVLYHPHDYKSADLVYREWKETHFLRDGDRTGLRAPGSPGIGYLRFDPGLPKIARRVVEGLAADTTFRLTAWVRQEAGATARLAAYGFDQADPGAERGATTDRAGAWVRLGVDFRTRRCVAGVDSWVVISLETDGRSTSCWDDVTLEPLP